MHTDYCKAIRHPVIGVRNMREITPNCKIVAYASDYYSVGKGPYSYGGLWYAIQNAVLAFKLKLHENKHNSSV